MGLFISFSCSLVMMILPTVACIQSTSHSIACCMQYLQLINRTHLSSDTRSIFLILSVQAASSSK